MSGLCMHGHDITSLQASIQSNLSSACVLTAVADHEAWVQKMVVTESKLLGESQAVISVVFHFRTCLHNQYAYHCHDVIKM